MKNPNLRTIHYVIPKSLDGCTIEAFLHSKGYSKNIVSHLKITSFEDPSIHLEDSPSDGTPCYGPTQEEGVCYGIMLNGRHAFTNHKLKTDDRLDIHILDEDESEFVPEAPIPIHIVYEDEDLQVVDKPANLPIHPSHGHYEDSLGNALCYYAHHHLKKDKFIFRVINRLDRDTSGLLISAKNMLSAGILGRAVANRDIHREYLAICQGNPFSDLDLAKRGLSLSTFPESSSALSVDNAASPASAPALRIEAPLLDQPDVAMVRTVDFERGVRAVTYMQLLQYDEEKDLSLLRLKLETGRTHQIRVHMLYLGHPLIGDFLYNPDYRYISRQALHSYSLRFHHPITGEALYFRQELPEDMRRLFPETGSLPYLLD